MPQMSLFGFPAQYVIGVIIITLYVLSCFKTPLISFFSKLQGDDFFPDIPLPYKPVAEDKLEVLYDPNEEIHSSDKPAPKGTADYIELVMQAAPDASDTLRLDYAYRELTEAQILRAEVTRKLPVAPTVEVKA